MKSKPVSSDPEIGLNQDSAPHSGKVVPAPAHKGHWRLDALALAGILAFALLLCSPILRGEVPVASNTLALWLPWSQLPHEPISNPDIADSALVSLPWNEFERASIADGEWPLWDPYSFSGQSFAANSQNQLYYPLTWLLWLLPLAGSIQLLAVSNIWIAGAGMYLLCRHFGISRTGTFVAALGFAGSGMLQLAIELPGPATSYGWLPWMLLATDRAIQVHSPRRIALAALACGAQLVSGNLQWCLYSYFVLALWIAWRCGVPVLRKDWGNVLSIIATGLVVPAGGIALAIVHLLPVLELVGLSTRSETVVSSHSGPLIDLLRLVMPSYFGTSADRIGAPLVFSDLWYAGIGLLMFAFLAILLSSSKSKWLWSGLAVFAVCVTYGIGPFLYVRWLPGLSGLVPSRIGYLFIFAVCILAAIGFDAWIDACATRPHRAVLALVAVALVGASALLCALLYAGGVANPTLSTLRWQQIVRAIGLMFGFSVLLLLPVIGRWLGQVRIDRRFGKQGVYLACCVCVVSLVVLDLASVAPDYNTYTSPSRLAPQTPAVDWLKSQPGFGRTMGLGINDQPAVLVPNVQTLFGFQSVDGYDSLHTERYEDYWSRIDPSVRPAVKSTPYSNLSVRPQVFTSTMADLLNVRYVAAAADLVPPVGLTKIYTGEISIYLNERAMPRAFAADHAIVMPNSKVLDTLLTSTFDAAHTILLESESRPPSLPAGQGDQPAPSVVTITRYARDSVQLQAVMTRPGWVVLGDQNYPGWSATVDGQSQQVYTADFLLRAVPVQAGDHSIVFSFLPSNYWPALAISVAAGALAIIAVAGNGWPFNRGRKRKR